MKILPICIVLGLSAVPCIGEIVTTEEHVVTDGVSIKFFQSDHTVKSVADDEQNAECLRWGNLKVAQAGEGSYICIAGSFADSDGIWGIFRK